MKKIRLFLKLLGLIVLFGLFSSNVLLAQTDVTSTYLTNAGFDISCNFPFDSTGSDLGTSSDGSTVEAVTGWTSTWGANTAASSYEYGATVTFNGYSVPSTGPDGTTAGSGHGTLAMCAAWGSSVTYDQDVTLPAGTYKLSYQVYNSGPTTAGASLAGWVPNSGSSILSTKTSFTQNVWTADTINFILSAETAGKIQLGVQSPGSGSGSNGRFFFDTLKLTHSSVILSENDTLQALTSDVGTLTPIFDPAITTYYLDVPSATASVTLTATASNMGATVAGDGVITLTSGRAIAEIVVTAELGNTQTYTVFIDDGGCYTPAYDDRANLIFDATFSAATLGDGGYSGWGPTGIINDGGQYCGSGSAYIRGSCWPDGGSIDLGLKADNGNALEPNSAYRLRAMLRSQASPGTLFQLVVNGYDGAGSNLYFDIDTTNGWEQFDTVFQTGSTVDATCGLYFNSCSNDRGLTSPQLTDSCFIDNYELYKLANDATLSALTVDVGTLVPTFSPDVTSYAVNVPATTTSVNVSATANDVGNVMVSGDGNVALTAGEGLAEIVITPESGFKKTYTITFSSTQSSDTTLSEISLNVPSIFTPAFDPSIFTYDVTVADGTDTVIVSATPNFPAATVTPSKDTVDVRSGSETSEILVKAEDGTEKTYTLNIAYEDVTCFVPLFDDGRTNYIPDPLMNSIDSLGGWGTKSIVIGNEAYCGLSAAILGDGTDGCNSALDIANFNWEANTAYRVRAMVKTIAGSIGILASGTDPNFGFSFDSEGEWAELDTTFKTGANPSVGFFSFNKCDFSSNCTYTYIDNYELYKVSSDATLSDLQVDGTTIAGFKADSIIYTIELPAGTTNVPVVTATTNDDNANVVITDATSLTDSTLIVVTAEDVLTKTTYTVKFNVAGTNGINEIAENSIVVYPTISTGNFTVKTKSAASVIRVYDINSKLVLEQRGNSNEQTLSISNTGMYIVKVESNDAIRTFKLFVTN